MKTDFQTLISWFEQKASLEEANANAWKEENPNSPQAIWRAGFSEGFREAALAVARLQRGDSIQDDFQECRRQSEKHGISPPKFNPF